VVNNTFETEYASLPESETNAGICYMFNSPAFVGQVPIKLFDCVYASVDWIGLYLFNFEIFAFVLMPCFAATYS
jgi:hypothetical protein